MAKKTILRFKILCLLAVDTQANRSRRNICIKNTTFLIEMHFSDNVYARYKEGLSDRGVTHVMIV